jgi:transposase
MAENQRYHPVGVPYPDYVRQNILHATGSVRERAATEKVSESTVRRVDKHYAQTGSETPRAYVHGPPRLLSETDAAKVAWFMINYPQAKNEEVRAFLKASSTAQISVSSSTISTELQRLGMSGKLMKYFSANRDEADRVNFWCNPPNHPERPDIAGVGYRDIVDIDESGFHPSDANRRTGHAFIGLPARSQGRIPRNEVTYTMLIALSVE